MGCRYGGTARSITPNTANDNWTLDMGSTVSGKILEVHWGGEVTTSTAMNTRICRATTNGVTPVAGNTSKVHPRSPAIRGTFATGWTTQPVLESGDLFCESWNAHGGVVRWLAAPGEEFVIIGGTPGEISCRNTSGTATSSYGLIWEED